MNFVKENTQELDYVGLSLEIELRFCGGMKGPDLKIKY